MFFSIKPTRSSKLSFFKRINEIIKSKDLDENVNAVKNFELP